MSFSPLRVRPFAAIAIWAALCLPASAAEWIQITSPNFNVVSDAGEKKAREVALRFEQMRLVFTMLIPKEKLHLATPVQVIAFRDSRGMMSVAPLYKGKPVEEAGLFQPGEDKNFIAVDVSSPNGWEAVFHEYAHVLLNSALPPMPVWFDEGFAEYYSTTKIDNKQIRLGDPPPYAVELLSDGMMPSEQLFAVQHGSKEYNESGERRTLFYAQSWLTVYWLISQHKLPEASKFMQLTQVEHLSIAEATKQAFGMTPKELDKTLKDYFRDGKVANWTAETPAGMESVTYPYYKMKDYEAEAVLADMHMHSPDHFEEGAREFQEVLQRKPDVADAYRGLGYYHLHKNELDKAAENFRRAAQLGSNDPRVYYFVAFSAWQKMQGTQPEPEDLVEMNSNLDQAIKLDPSYADAYNLKAYTLARSRNLTEAIRLMKTAIQLSPRNQIYLSNLAGFYMQERKFDEAMDVLAKLEESDDPAVVAQARQQMEQAKEWKKSPLTQLAAEEAAQNVNNKWGPPAGTSNAEEKQLEEAQNGEGESDKRPLRFLKGTVAAADCSTKPGALLTVVSAKKSYKLRVRDLRKLVLIGADNFSCTDLHYKVAVNYRESGPTTGEVISVEVE